MGNLEEFGTEMNWCEMWEIEVLYDEDLEVSMYIMSALLSQQILVNIYITLQTYRNQIFFFFLI